MNLHVLSIKFTARASDLGAIQKLCTEYWSGEAALSFVVSGSGQLNLPQRFAAKVTGRDHLSGP